MTNEITKKDFIEWKEESKRHSSVLYEKFQKDLKTMTEGLATKEDLKQHATKEDLKQYPTKEDLKSELRPIAEMVAQNTEDITIMKSDISFIKNALKTKVDHDEFAALEKRVLFLENKFKRI